MVAFTALFNDLGHRFVGFSLAMEGGYTVIGLALIIGDDELQAGTISVKKLDDGEQFSVSRDNLLFEVSKYLSITE